MIFSSILTLEEYLGHYHAVVWFVTLAFFSAAFIADLFYYFGKEKALIWGHWFIILGVLSCIPTLMTGLAAEVNFDPTNFFLIKHGKLGFATAVAGSFYAGIRIAAMLWSLPLKPIHYAFLSLLLLALTFWTIDYGWLIRFASAGV